MLTCSVRKISRADMQRAVMCRVVMCSVESNVRKCKGRNGVCGTHVTPCDDNEGKGDSVWKVRRPEPVRSLEVAMQHGFELLKALGVLPLRKYGTGQAIPGPGMQYGKACHKEPGAERGKVLSS